MALETKVEGDIKLAEKLRREDPEQFHTLVRMHLSFVLDLHTDESDCIVEKAKFRPLKWGFTPFSKKGKCFTKGVMEGAPLTLEGICQVYQLIEYLGREHNVCQEGIFRRSGKMTRQQELKALLNQGMPLTLDNGQFSVHDCASVLKNFLAELPESLLTDAHYPAYCQIAEFGGEGSEPRLLRSLQLLLLLLPPENQMLLRDLVLLLHLTASHEASNKMSADSLATLFTPHLLCPRKLTPKAFHINSQTMSGVVAFMIRQGEGLFDVPPKLATDIRAYWAELQRRKLSPKKQLNESICDSTAANTVFSFVDRERSAQAHVANPTEAALAQLYAHIQLLPESTKKRKLIKQFNKENGQGTPLKGHHRSRSLSNSIKKHMPGFSNKRPKGCAELTTTSQPGFNETMMTPRSRKPVVLVSSSNLCQLVGPWPSQLPSPEPSVTDNESGDSLTSTFRSYLLNRSVLTTSPVDLSFSSCTEDFDSSSAADSALLEPGELSESLQLCLDGHSPQDVSRKRRSDQDSSPEQEKRSLVEEGVRETSL